MNEQTQLLINLVKQNKTLNEISKILGLSNKQLFIKLSMLRSSGYLIDKNYYYNGEIRYSLHNPFKPTSNTIHVITPKYTNIIRIVLTSDTHLGHKQDNLKCIDSTMEYCINNGIHLIFNLGDFFEGIYDNRKNSVKFATAAEQISYGLKNYPYDKSILNFVLLGNHDATFWAEDGIDIQTILSERRHDIVPVGYGYHEINVGGCQFKLRHYLKDEQKQSIPIDANNRIILKGHSHKFKIAPSTNNLSVTLPALSNVGAGSEKSAVPSIIDMQLKIENNIICEQYFQQIIFIENKPILINEIKYYVPINLQNPIYEEDIKKKKLK